MKIENLTITKKVRTRLNDDTQPINVLSAEELAEIKKVRPNDIKNGRYFVNAQVKQNVTVDFSGDDDSRLAAWAVSQAVIQWQNSKARKDPEKWLKAKDVTFKTVELFSGRKIGGVSDERGTNNVLAKVKKFAESKDKNGFNVYVETLSGDASLMAKQMFALWSK